MTEKSLNCQERIQTLENEIEKTNLESKLIQIKLDLQTSLLEQFKENKLLLNENTQLNNKLKEINLEMSKFKEENKLELLDMLKIRENNEKLTKELEYSKNLISQLQHEKLQDREEMEKIQKDAKDQLGLQNALLLQQLEDCNSELLKYKEENNLNFAELSKIREKCQELNNESTNAKNLLSQLQGEESQKAQKFNNEIEKILTEKNQVYDQLNQLNVKIAELTSELEQLRKETGQLHFIPIENKIVGICEDKTCCFNKCINSNISDGTCYYDYGIVRVHDDGKVKYYSVECEGYNCCIGVYAQNSFTNTNYFHCYSLFYYEITMIEEETNSTKQYAELGFKNAKIFLLNDLEGDNLESDYQEFSWSDGDIFGCGLVFPPKKKSEELPYIFFTKNGSRIGYDIASEEEENLCPVVSLLACSVKINFGNDLVTDPFCYNFSEYKCIILEF